MNAQPQSIEKKDARTLNIVWSDGQATPYDVVALRRACVCAHCVDEMTRAQILKPEQVSESVRPVKVRNLGRYALVVDWTDGHSSSIYSWPYLRKIAQLQD
jgi:ATP-binding protein involved in chromosome partitioning